MNARLNRMINAGCNNVEIEDATRNQAYAAADRVKITAECAANTLLGIIGELEEKTNLRDLAAYMKRLQDAVDQVAFHLDCAKRETTEAASDLIDAVQYLGQD